MKSSRLTISLLGAVLAALSVQASELFLGPIPGQYRDELGGAMATVKNGRMTVKLAPRAAAFFAPST